jgi:tetratricopeptide (TPR) repeat protein
VSRTPAPQRVDRLRPSALDCALRDGICRIGPGSRSWFLITLAPLLMIIVGSGSTTAQTRQSRTATTTRQGKSQLLELDQPIKRTLSGGEHHSYAADLESGELARIVVHPQSIDVVLVFSDPETHELVRAESPYGVSNQGPVSILLLAPASRKYDLEVSAADRHASIGRYEIAMEELRAAAPEDNIRTLAQRRSADAEQKREEGSGQALSAALRDYEDILPLCRAARDQGCEALALNRIGEVAKLLSKFQIANRYYEEASTLFHTLADDRGEGLALTNLGDLYVAQNEGEKALGCYNQALELRRKVGDVPGEVDTLAGVAIAYDESGDEEKALEYNNQAIALAEKVNYVQAEGILLNNAADTYKTMGENQKALDYYNRGLPMVHAAGLRFYEAAALNNLGRVYDDLGEKQKALDYYRRSLPLRRAVSDLDGEASTIYNIGIIYGFWGDRDRQLSHYKRALRLAKEARDGGLEARIVDALALISAASGDKQASFSYLDHSLSVIRDEGDKRWQSILLADEGWAHRRFGEPQAALDCYRQALQLAEANRDSGTEVAVLGGMARVERDQGNIPAATQHIETALGLAEAQRTRVASQDLRASYFGTVADDYKFYVDLLMDLDQLHAGEGYGTKAFEAAERSRARSLLETLIDARADIRRGVDSQLLGRERSLAERLNLKSEWHFRLLNGKHTEGQIAAAEGDIETLLAEYQEVETKIRASSPRYAALIQPQTLNLQQIQYSSSTRWARSTAIFG